MFTVKFNKPKYMILRPVIPIISIFLIVLSCKNVSEQDTKNVEVQSKAYTTFDNKGHELVYHMVEKVGNYKKLKNKRDVVYNYTYTTPDGKTDISTEKYIFDGELSYGKYKQHERTLPHLMGVLEQGYDGKEFWLKANGKVVNDTTALKRVKFNRPTNYYWFTMFQKLLDPGLNYDYLGEKVIDSNRFDVVKISFELKHNNPTDIYQLYINKTTGLVDQFLFTVADFGAMEPRLMQLKYETIDGFIIPTKRQYKLSNWDAKITDEPWILVDWTNITFTSNLSISTFAK